MTQIEIKIPASVIHVAINKQEVQSMTYITKHSFTIKCTNHCVYLIFIYTYNP